MQCRLSKFYCFVFLFSALIFAAPTFAQEEEKPAGMHLPQQEDSLTLTEEEPHAETLPEGQVKNSKNVAALRALNKVTARTSDIKIAPNTIAHFGNLEILMINCWKSPPEEKPEAAALLQIWEKRPNELRQQVFLGWMFASSPAISALEHAVYDIQVMDCIPPEKSDK